MKKKSFFSFFIKRWIPLLIVAGIVAFFATEFIHTYVYNKETTWQREWLETSIKGSLDPVLEQLIENPSTIESEEERQRLENLAAYFITGYKPCVLYNPASDEIVYPKENLAIIRFTNPATEKLNFYTCPLSYFDSIDIDAVDEIRVRDFYIKDLNFLPGNVDIVDVLNAYDEIVVDSVDLTPSDTSGYTHVEGETSLVMFSIIPEYDINLAEFGVTPDVRLNTLSIMDSYMLYDCYDISNYRLGKTDYMLISRYPVDIWDLGKIYFIGTYAGLFFTSLFVAIIAALLAYKRYEMLRYQRNLTNALAHDLKSPLMVVSGYVQNLSDNVYPEKKDAYTTGISQNVQYMNDIINNILELSRIRDKKSPLTMETQNIAPLFQNILEKYDTLIREKQLSLRLTGDTTAKCDTVSLTRAFDNLITNAISHSSEKGTIEIQISEKQIVISNPYTNEITCKPEKLFEPFTKGDDSRSNTGGTGIGLSIAKSILEQHKFSVKINLKGNVFTVIVNL